MKPLTKKQIKSHKRQNLKYVNDAKEHIKKAFEQPLLNNEIKELDNLYDREVKKQRGKFI